jgi:membrane associated rhomboid family serine protease
VLASVAIPQICTTLSTWAVSIFWLSIADFGKIVFAFLLGSLILKLFIPKYAQTRIWPFLAGVVLYALLAPIPHTDWLIAVVGTLFGLGAIWMLSRLGKQPEDHSEAELQPAGENHDMSVVSEG